MDKLKGLAIFVLLISIPLASAEINFRSSTPIDFYNDINIRENQITNLTEPIGNKDAVRKQYVDGKYYKLSGDTLQGPINTNGYNINGFFGNSCGPNQAVKDIYNNGSLMCGQAGGGLPTVLDLNNNINQNIDANGYTIENLSEPINSNDAARLQDIASGFVNQSGDTLSGNLSFNNQYYIKDLKDPINNQDAATKSYVENYADNNDDTGTDDQNIQAPSRTGNQVTIQLENGGSTTFTDNYEANTDSSTKCGSDEVLEGGNNCVNNYELGDDGDSSSSNEIQDLGQVLGQNNNADNNVITGLGGGTASIDGGDIRFQPDSAGGTASLSFQSNVNSGSDGGWLTWYDDNNNYNYWGDSSENGALILGVTNDGQGDVSDVTVLKSPAAAVIDAPLLRMSGASINMGGNRIQNLANPSSNDDAINRGYADGRYILEGQSGDVIADNTIDNSEIQNGATFTFEAVNMNLGEGLQFADGDLAGTYGNDDRIIRIDDSNSPNSPDGTLVFTSGEDDKILLEMYDQGVKAHQGFQVPVGADAY